MAVPDKKWWAMARRARDKLAQLVQDDPAVQMIDIGKDDTGQSNTSVLRVHVHPTAEPQINVPSDIDGIPVRVIPGDYTLEE
jgi:hypothetical protein